MSERTDLTRWNRAGLSHFRYIDGNAATYLELLRQALFEYFPNWEEVQNEPISEEAIQQVSGRDRESLLRKRQEQLLQRYQTESRDMGWLIARSLARACHILTEHADAYANEGYIGTATQWDHVRRMVEILDYHPAPPASATTWLALMAKENKAGEVAEGFQVKYAPEDGGSPVKFETLDDIEIDSALNQLQLKDWNKSQTFISGSVVWVKENGDSIEELEISSGDVALLLNAESKEAKVISIDEVVHAAGTMAFAPPGFSGAEFWPEHHVKLLTGAKDVRAVKISGEGVVEFDQATGLSAGDVISWDSSGWKFNEVVETDGKLIRLDNPGIFPGNGAIYRLYRLDETSGAPFSLSEIIFPLVYENVVVRENGTLRFITPGDFDEHTNDDGYDEFNKIINANISEIYVRYESDDAMLEQVESVNPSNFVVDGAPKGFRNGDWLVGASGDQRFALQIKSIEEREDDFIIRFLSFGAGSKLERIYGPLQYTLRPEDFDRNEEKLDAGNNIELKTLPASLIKGRTVLLECDGKTLVSEVKELGIGTTIELADEIKADTFIKADTKIYANVIRAGHGERKPEKILGSGDATQSNQSFVFSVADVSFVPDATMASGVRADIDVAVDGQVWEQVSSFNDSAPTDIHYTIRMTEEGFLKIIFGDGTLARRLPTGKNNIRVSYRLGTGLGGNLDPHSLEKPVKPHAYVKSVVHPVLSTGGNAMEDAGLLLENAPPTVLTLERAVSISDFARLAASHSSIWQANAFVRLDASGRNEHIEVVVVPADGGELGELETILQDHLLSHALPGVQVSVTRFDTLQPQADVTIHVDSDQYDPEMVEADVRTALLDTFSLKQRKLGQNLYLSEIYAVVENMTGVERSICNLRESDGTNWVEKRVVKAGSQRRVVYLESLDLIMQPPKEYEP